MHAIIVVHEALKKVGTVAELLAEFGLLKNATMKALFDACKSKVNPSTFKSAVYSGRLTKAMCDELSRLCNMMDQGSVDLSDDETFVDKSIAQAMRESTTYPDYPGRDGPKAFAKKLRARYGLGPNIQIRVLPANPRLLDENLLTFEVDGSGQSTPLGEPVPLFFSVISNVSRDPSGVTFGLNSVRIQLKLEDTSDVRTEKRLGGVKLRDARLSAEGLSKNAIWTLRASQGSALQGEYVTSDQPFCGLTNLAVGSSVLAIAATNILEPGAIVVTTPTEVESTTKAIIKRLLEKSLEGNSDSGGWKTFARQNIRIVKA